MARLVGINHLAVQVGDIDAAIAFFERIFDDVQLRGRGGNMAFVDLGDQFVAWSLSKTPFLQGTSASSSTTRRRRSDEYARPAQR